MTPADPFKEVKKTVFKIPVYQLLIGIVIAIVFFLISGKHAAVSAFSGAMVSTLGSVVFAMVVFGFSINNQNAMVGRMLKAEITKFLVIGILLYVAMKFFSFLLMPLLIGFIATLFAFWVALLTSFK
ncbi:MAG: ATP synthase subunit I [Proteobacteria bacterium]|nr:ATP synthase subunit I [Pseudomonadota bacterium]